MLQVQIVPIGWYSTIREKGDLVQHRAAEVEPGNVLRSLSQGVSSLWRLVQFRTWPPKEFAMELAVALSR